MRIKFNVIKYVLFAMSSLGASIRDVAHCVKSEVVACSHDDN
jgi:hypothetical protein